MRHGCGAAELDFAQGKRERHGRERDQHQHPEGIHVGKERRLGLDLLSDPVDRLLVRLGRQAALGGEIVRCLLERLLVLDARRDRIRDEPALMQLLVMGQHV